MEGKAPDWAHTWTINRLEPLENRDVVEYLLVQDKASLLYLINLGAVDVNPWLSRYQNPDFPSWAVVDIDPTNSPFEHVVEVALKVKQLLDQHGISGYPKTSGKSGIHVYLPLDEKCSYHQAEQLVQLIAEIVARDIPQLVTLERQVVKRGRKVYIDWMQNKKQQTVCAPYSVRPYPGATVSTPLEWKEVNSQLQPADFNFFTIRNRLQQKGDLFAVVLEKHLGLDVQEVLQKLQLIKAGGLR